MRAGARLTSQAREGGLAHGEPCRLPRCEVWSSPVRAATFWATTASGRQYSIVFGDPCTLPESGEGGVDTTESSGREKEIRDATQRGHDT